MAALIAVVGFGGSYAYAEEADQAPAQLAPVEEGTENPEVKTTNFGLGLTFKELGQHRYEPVEGTVISLTNKETGEVINYTTSKNLKIIKRYHLECTLCI